MALKYKIQLNLFYPHNDNPFAKYDVAVCGIFKDESPYLEEWINHHLSVGVDHFYLYNNNSTDDYQKVLSHYINIGLVDLIDWPLNQQQLEAYKDCIEKYSNQSKWIGFVDIDEFVIPVKHNSIYEFLKQFEKNRGSVVIYNVQYGSSGIVNRDLNTSVMESFTKCWPKYCVYGKCFINTKYKLDDTDYDGPFHHRLWTRYQNWLVPPVNCFDHISFMRWNIAPHKEFPIKINHYCVKSLSEYENRIKKTDVFYKNNPHDMKFFEEINRYCEE